MDVGKPLCTSFIIVPIKNIIYLCVYGDIWNGKQNHSPMYTYNVYSRYVHQRTSNMIWIRNNNMDQKAFILRSIYVCDLVK